VNVLILLLGTVAVGVAIPWAVRADRADAHLIHLANCPDCAANDEWAGL
jgi:hypothetical protein